MQPQRFFLLLVSTVLWGIWGIWGICSSHDKVSLQGKRISQMTGIHHVYLCPDCQTTLSAVQYVEEWH